MAVSPPISFKEARNVILFITLSPNKNFTFWCPMYRESLLLVIITLTSLSTFAQVDQRLPTTFSLQINGLVRYATTHQPAETVLVRIESFSGGLVSQVNTDRTGKFSFSGLTAMQYIVTAHAPGYQDVRENVDLLTSNSGYLNIELVGDKNAVGSDKTRNSDFTVLPVISANIPADAQTEFAKGQALLDAKSEDAAKNAVKNFEKAVAIYPKYLEAQILLGLTYMDLQKWDKAEKPLLAAMEINQEASTAYFALGEVYRREKKYSQGEEILTKAFKLNANAPQGHLTLAQIYWDRAPSSVDEKQFRKDAEAAWKEVSIALQQDPNLAEAHLLAGNLLLRARRGEAALAQFEQYLKLKPDGPFAAETKVLVQKIKDSLAKTGKNS
jgi:Tfp pilus assembly protein PilF